MSYLIENRDTRNSFKLAIELALPALLGSWTWRGKKAQVGVTVGKFQSQNPEVLHLRRGLSRCQRPFDPRI